MEDHQVPEEEIEQVGQVDTGQGQPCPAPGFAPPQPPAEPLEQPGSADKPPISLRDTLLILVLTAVADLGLYRVPGGTGVACLLAVTVLLLAVAAGRRLGGFDWALPVIVFLVLSRISDPCGRRRMSIQQLASNVF